MILVEAENNNGKVYCIGFEKDNDIVYINIHTNEIETNLQQINTMKIRQQIEFENLYSKIKLPTEIKEEII